MNFTETAFILGACTAGYSGGYPCRAVHHVIDVEKPSAVVASIYAAHGTELGHDVVVGIIVDGSQCGANRFPASAGFTGLASASCSRWVTPGRRTVTLYLTSSTNLATRAGVGISAGILVM